MTRNASAYFGRAVLLLPATVRAGARRASSIAHPWILGEMSRSPSWLRCADSAAIFTSIVSVTSIQVFGEGVELT